MGPIDYLGAMPQQDFLRDIQGGLQTGMAYRQNQVQQQQQQLALQQAQQYKTDIAAAMANPTPQAFSALTLKYPTQREAVKQAWDGMSAADQKTEGDTMAQAYSALLSGQPDVAKKVVQAQIDARKNSGLDTSHYDNALSLLDTDPKQAQGALGFALSHISDPKTFAASFGTLSEVPGKVAEADATTAGKQADNILKNQQILGQTAGALAKPGVKPGQAIAMFKSLEARGVIPKGGAQGYIDGIPTDPKDLPDYLKQVQASGMKPDDQMKFTTPTADAQLSSDTSVKTAGISAAASRYSADSSARTAANRLGFDKDQAAAEDAPDTTSDAEKKNWVHQYVAGNGSVPRSAPASVRNHVGTWAAEMGITPADLSAGSAQAKFDQATAVTSGHRAGSMASVEATMPALTANAMELSHKLGQGKFVPLNQLIQMADDKISDPALSAFKVAHQAVVSEYQQVISRGGTNVTALKEAMHVLNGAKSMQAYDVALNQVNKEVAINVAGTKAVRAGLGGQHGEQAPAASAAHPADISALLNKYGSK